MSDWQAPLVIESDIWDIGHFSIQRVGSLPGGSSQSGSSHNSSKNSGIKNGGGRSRPSREALAASAALDRHPFADVPDGPQPCSGPPLCRCEIEVIERERQEFRAFSLNYPTDWFDLWDCSPDDYETLAFHARRWVHNYLQANRQAVARSRSDRPMVVHVGW
jgi:hypothetical protein